MFTELKVMKFVLVIIFGLMGQFLNKALSWLENFDGDGKMPVMAVYAVQAT